MSSVECPNQSNEMAIQEGTAIVGMACLFPGARDLQEYWQNIVSKVDAITDPPPEAWDSDVYYDPNSPEDDRVYCKRGGYIGPLAQFDPLKYNIMPMSVAGEPDQWLALKLAYDALADAGYRDRIPEGHRTAVILGKGTYLNYGNMTVVQRGLVVDQTLQIVKTLLPGLSDSDVGAIRKELRQCLPHFNAESASGLVPNIIAGRIANRLDLMGPSYTVDGACASSLLAIEIAAHDLLSGRIDVALVGGSQVSTPVPVLGLFCQINAVSRREQIRPFDKDADGTLLGEGIGMIVLKRLSDAVRDGNRIYAVIKGVGSSSDGRGLGVLAPRVEGQKLALQRAYEITGISPSTIGLIEAHGTGTPAGDLAEIQTLREIFGKRNSNFPQCAIGSVKSMIGHTMPAAGIAAVIKAALSLYHKVLPPTLNVTKPDPKFELEKTAFYINTETRPWVHASHKTPRRAGVNAFGFGGINAHVILEEMSVKDETSLQSLWHHWETEICVLDGESRSELIERIKHLQRYLSHEYQVSLKDLAYTLNTRLDGSPYRLALVVSSLKDLLKKTQRALSRIEDADCRQIKDVKGIYFFEQPLYPQGKIAFLFPGEGAQYVNMLSDLCIHFPEVRSSFDHINRIVAHKARDYLPSDYIFPAPAFSADERKAAGERLWKMDRAVESVLTANDALFNLMSRLEIRPDMVLGHSTGEYSAMRAAGVFSLVHNADNDERAIDMNQSHEEMAARNEIPSAKLIAVGADSERVTPLLNGLGGEIHIAMKNCPHQTVIVGSEAEIQDFIDELDRQGLIYQTLPFDRPYHTPLFKAFAQSLRRFLDRWPVHSPRMPIYSCTSIAPFPHDPDRIRELVVEHWQRPVEFEKTIKKMYEDGARIFLEIGPNSHLSAFVDDILRGQNYAAVPVNVQRRSGITQINHMLGILTAHGVPVNFDYLYRRRAPERISFEGVPDERQTDRKSNSTVKLATGWPSLHLSPETAEQLRSQDTTITPHAVDPSSASKDSQVSARESPPDEGKHPLSESQQATLRQGAIEGVMSAYMETMECFLESQKHIMQEYLATTGHGILADESRLEGPLEKGSHPRELSDISEIVERTHPITQPQPLSPDPGSPIQMPGAKTVDGPFSSGTRPKTVQGLHDTLLGIVSDKTGYPQEMLDPNLDMEADLGIDSIKRIEILGALSERCSLKLDQDMERIAALKTLQQVVDFLREHLAGPLGLPSDVRGSEDMLAHTIPGAVSSATGVPSSYSMIGEVVSLVPGQELEAIRRISLDEDRYLHDHTLGGKISMMDDTLFPLPVMPLTLSMEILAEAGALLAPGKVLTGIKNIRAFRWISLEEDPLTLKITAHVDQDVPEEVQVRVYRLSGGEAALETLVIEGISVFAKTYPQIPSNDAFSLRRERPSRWSPEQLYTQAMFHGPCWQAVSSVERWGEDGSVATLEVLPTHGFFRSEKTPRFVTDPIVLDAAGQIVGFWTMEHLERGFVVFPYRVNALHIYRPQLPVRYRVKCQARIRLVGTQQVSSDIDMIAEDGRPWMRLEAWEDKRFDLPPKAYAFLLSPIKVMASTHWDAPIASLPNPDSLCCLRIDRLFQGDEFFWRQVFAHLILNHKERKTFRTLGKSEKRLNHWLLGRLVAKDAVRTFLKERYGMELGPADVEITTDEFGRPIPTGIWARQVEGIPCLSLAHTNGMAVAMSGHPDGDRQVGIDVERIRPLQKGFEKGAFAPQELELVNAFDGSEHEQWLIRFWCAKEALAKALGRGLLPRPLDLTVQDLDALGGTVKVSVEGRFVQEFPDLRKKALCVQTIKEGNCIVASTVFERNGHA